MGRKSLSAPLVLWANGIRIGVWHPGGHRPTELQYATEWLEHPAVRPLSLSLPLPLLQNEPLRGAAVENYFDNLLPDSPTIRRRIAQRFGMGTAASPFDLLATIGRDCVGALQLLSPDEAPTGFNRIEGQVLDEEDVARLLRGAVASSGPGRQAWDDEFRISIAGAQEKTALLRVGNQWLLPHGATPTTHIIKLPLGVVGNMQADLSTSVYNEWLCLRLLAAFGLNVAQASVERFADHPPVLVVERFDRRKHASDSWIMRLPQEDFCQALGISPQHKYEADGGPGVRDIARILHASRNAREDLRTLLKSQILFWLMAATDGHAKNFSIGLLAQGQFELKPLYDVISAWPIIGSGARQLPLQHAKLAMAMWGRNAHYGIASVMRRHMNALARQCGWGESGEDLVAEVLDGVEPAIEQVTAQLPVEFPSFVAEAIFAGMRVQAQRLQSQPPS